MNNENSTKYKVTNNIQNESTSHGIMINYITSNSTILDVGCACGDLGVYLHNNKNCKCYGLEYNEGSVKIALETGCYEDVRQCDLDYFEEMPFNTKFDYIILGDVLEHLKYPMDLLNKLKKYLNGNGRFVISLPNISHAAIKSNLLVNNWNYTYAGLLDNTHIRFFTYKTIAEYFANNGLKIEECKFTFYQKNEFQPYDAFNDLPCSVRYYILKDWHSYVQQYVMSVSLSDECSKDLFKSNIELININKNNATKQIKNYRKENLIGSFISLPIGYSLLEWIFSVKNSSDKAYKIICIAGLKIKIKRKNF